MSSRWRALKVLSFSALLLFNTERAFADHISEAPLQWTNSAWLGAGFYQVGQEETFHVSIPTAFTFARSKKVKYQLSTALSLGLRGFRLITLTPPEELSTLSFAPGLQVVYQHSARWALKPFAQLGLGWAFSEQTRTVQLVSAGIKSLYHGSIFGLKANFGQRIVVSSYQPLNSDEQSPLVKRGSPILVAFNTGVELREVITHTLGQKRFDMSLISVQTLFTPELGSKESLLSWTVSAGFNIGAQEMHEGAARALKPRAGLYYVFGDERLRGLRISLGFPF